MSVLASLREWSVVSAWLRIRAQPRNHCQSHNSASASTWKCRILVWISGTKIIPSSQKSSVFTRGQFWPPGIVVACVFVCVCVYQSLACPHDNSSPVQVRITKFGPEKQNTLVKIPIVLGGNWPWPSRTNLASNSKLTPFWACPNHYSPPILVRIPKFGQQMHFSTVKIPDNSGLDWPWTSSSFLIPKLIFLHCGGVHWDCETVPGLFQCCSQGCQPLLNFSILLRKWGPE